MVGPCFAVSCLQGSFDQSEETIVVDVVSEDMHQGVVVDIVVTTLDVSFDEPLGASPGLVYFG